MGKCTCRMTKTSTGLCVVFYCPMHKAAPDLLAAAGGANFVLINRHNKNSAQWEALAQAALDDIRDAIAAATE